MKMNRRSCFAFYVAQAFMPGIALFLTRNPGFAAPPPVAAERRTRG